jgi:hypothetical protein
VPRDNADSDRETQRILDRIGGDTAGHGLPAGRDRPAADDWPEIWGRRIGRTLGAVLVVVLIVWLFGFLTGPE